MVSNDSASEQQITDASFEDSLKLRLDTCPRSVQAAHHKAVRDAILARSATIKQTLYGPFNGRSSECDRFKLSICQSSHDPVKYNVWISCYPWSSEALAEIGNSHSERFTVQVQSSTSGDRTADSKA